jgi:DNA-binding protein HU-beta
MNKADLVESIRSETGSTRRATVDFINAFMFAVSSALAKEQIVQLVGFGSFSVAKIKGRLGRNPKTGESLKIKASKRVRFSVGKKLKAAVNNSSVS